MDGRSRGPSGQSSREDHGVSAGPPTLPQTDGAAAEAPQPPLAIVGIGCLFPGSRGLEGYWSRILDGTDAITEVPATHWRREDYYHPDPKAADRVYACRGGFLESIPFPPAQFGIAPNNLEATDTAQLLGLVVAREALLDAGYEPEPGAASDPRYRDRALRLLDRRRVSVILGVTGTLELVIPLGARLGHPIWRRALRDAGVEESVAEDVVRRIAHGYVPWQENSFPGLLGNVVAGRIANRLDLGGTNCVVDAACASSLGAIHLAALELISGRSDVVLTGGVDTFNDVFMFTCFSKTPALSPSGDARPFDSAADGTVLGEGVGVIVLKRLADARRDGDRVYAVLRGMGTASDGRGDAVYAPRREGQVKALASAYRTAGISPATIELVEAHGTGTKVGDATEAAALAEVYRGSGRTGTWCALGSVKSQIGHTKAAAGVAGLIKAAAALYHKVLPPTIKVRQPLDEVRPGAGPLYVNTEARPWLASPSHPRRAAVSAFGFGGSNFHCVLEEDPSQPPPIHWDGEVQILAHSAHDPEGLRRQLSTVPTGVDWGALRAHAAQSRQDWDPARNCRLLLVLQRHQADVPRLLETAARLLREDPSAARQQPTPGIYYGRGPVAGKLAVLFPGQGAQYPGMLRDLACRFPAMQQSLAAAEAAFRATANSSRRLTDYIYPLPAFSAAERADRETLLQSTSVAQPAIGAVSLGAWRLLESFGIQPAFAAGHSFGELTALCAAGRLSEDDFHRLAVLRGRLMAEQSGSGGMLAVKALAEVITPLLKQEGLDLVLANRNAPEQIVLSGAIDQIERAETVLARQGLIVRRLQVSHAFHSPLVAAAAGPLHAALEQVAFAPGAVPILANTTALPYPEDTGLARALLAEQLARPVEWTQQIEELHATGARTFLEVGPGRRLSGLVISILQGRDGGAVALDASEGKRPGVFDLACCLAELAARGHSLRLQAWDPAAPQPEPAAQGAGALVIPLCGANYVKPRPPLAAVPKPEPRPSSNGDPVSTKNGSMPPAQPTPPAGGALAAALQVTRESLAALQKMQEQTANLHRQFLEGQEAAQRTIQTLVEQQQRLLQASLGQAPTAPLSIAPPPVPPMAVAPPPAATTPASAPALAEPAPLAPPPPVSPPLPPRRTEAILLEVVSEKTGYPAEMLGLDMALDTDLGIDSIKRVEILSALQERLPEAPQVRPEHLGSLQTLRHVADFLAGSGQTNGTGGVAPAAAQPRTPSSNGKQTGTAAVADVLLQVVSEKTGYPAEMLGLDMALDTDLGIDSIKRVEILSALQERLPEAPQVRPEHLGSLQTLRHVADFLAGSSQSNGAADGPEERVETAAAQPVLGGPPSPFEPDAGSQEQQSILASALQRSVPQAVLLEAPTGPAAPALPAGSEVWVTADDKELSVALTQRLQAMGLRPRCVPCADLPSLSLPRALGGLLLIAPAAGVEETFIRDALRALHHTGPVLRAAGQQGGAILASVSRLDGAFGLHGIDPDREPVDGGLAGLTKTAAHEWPEVRCRALDLAADFPTTEATAAALLEELFRLGPVEIGLFAGGRRTVECIPAPLTGVTAAAPLAAGDVVVLSGGARGITAEVAVALARAWQPTLVLLGRSPDPHPEPDWLAALRDEGAIKRALAVRANGSASPRQIGEQYRQVTAAREVRQTLERIAAAGARALYHGVDVRDRAAVAGFLAAIRRDLGPIRALMHGAGVLADARIEDKTVDQFDRVWGTKVDGLRNLLAGLAVEELRALVLFSSSTARFGRAGQCDYAAANEALNKQACRWARRLPGCRVVSFNWGPWQGGMVDAGLQRLFQSEGIGLIDPAAGAELVIRELSSAGGPAEVVVLAPGRTPDRPHSTSPTAQAAPLPPALPVAFQRVVDRTRHPVLQSHQLDGRPVVPVVLLLEWLAHAALHHNPGLLFHGCDNLRVLSGVILEADTPPVLYVGAAKAVRQDSFFVAAAELRGRRSDGREVLHARADVVLASQLPAAPPAGLMSALPSYERSIAEVYEQLLFHGPLLHGIESIDGCGPEGIVGRVRTSPPPAEWIIEPLRQRWLADPLALDGSFQLMVLWSRQQRGAPSLPCHIQHYRQFRRSFPAGSVRALARVTHVASSHALADIEYIDAEGQLIARVEGYDCVIDASLERAFARSNVMSTVRAGS